VTDCRDLSATELQQTIVDAASAYSGGELEDDVTLVVVRITGRMVAMRKSIVPVLFVLSVAIPAAAKKISRSRRR
jgi:hypothetical protein